jgi:ComF family protein
MTELTGLPAGNTGGSLRANRIRLLAHELVNKALDFLFPPRCIQCKRVGSLLCRACQALYAPPPPLIEWGSPLAECRATAQFEGAIRDAIHALKYENQRRFAEPLSERLSVEFARSGWTPTGIIAAPLHEARLRARGYNQSALLAERLARSEGIPYRPDFLSKIRDTQPQVGLNGRERALNVKDAFRASGSAANQMILLIDDVYTTGATLRECARALLEAGASQVWALTVASAKQRDVVDSPPRT